MNEQKRGRILRSGYQVALAGRPNAGKSSLLNALLNEQRAIVTDVPGTTRDLVDGEIAIDGFRVTLTDTAGLRNTDDVVEKIGVERSIAKVREVDRIFYLVDGEAGWLAEDAEILSGLPKQNLVVVWNKCDLRPTAKIPVEFQSLAVSAKTGEGLDGLRIDLRNALAQEFVEDAPSLSNARHLEGLLRIKKSLEESLQLIIENTSPDLIALELQIGLQTIHELLGLVYDEDVMDRVFQEFCIGK